MKVRLHGLRPLQEELHGWVLLQRGAVNLLEWGALGKHGQCERERYKLLLGTQVQYLAARNQQLHPGACFQQCRQVGSSRDDLLKVVQHQQHPPLVQRACQECESRQGARLAQSQRLCQGRQHQLRVIQRGQGDELHALRERLDKLRRHLQRQAGFAHPCAPRQGEQVYLGTLEQRAHCPHLLLSPDQGGGRYGKLAPANRRSISKWQALCQPRFPPGQLPPSALIWRQMQRLGQQVQGLLVWSAGQPALQNADGIRADARTRGQFFLGQPGCAAGVPQ